MSSETAAQSNQLSELAIILIALFLVLIDICYTAARAWIHRPGADNFLEYLVSRGSVLVIIGISRVIETLLPNVPLVYLTCLFYSAVSVAHVIDSAVLDGVPIPPPLVSAVKSIRNAGSGGSNGKGTSDKVQPLPAADDITRTV